MNALISFLARAVAPTFENEDKARRQFILNILLVGAASLLFIGVLVDIFDRFFISPELYSSNSLSSFVLYALFLFFVGLYAFSRRKLVELASYLLLGAFFLLSAYMGYHWGVDVTASLLFYAVTIVMAGILINTRLAFIMTVLVGVVMAATGYLQQYHLIMVQNYWRMDRWKWSDIIMIFSIMLIIATVSWLSNREIEKSLKRARRSESELMQERDLLEVRVEERTRELRQAEIEKMSQAYHFVEFGRLAGSVFHDLMNPLTALSLNIDSIAAASETRAALAEDVQRAKRATVHMQELLDAMRKHLARSGSVQRFSLRDTLNDVVHVLGSYARKQGVHLLLEAPGDGEAYGDPVAFTQVMSNLIGNAVQAYAPGAGAAGKRGERAKDVRITLEALSDGARISVRDHAPGIAPDVLPHIFEPFFTTKQLDTGLGLGLSLSKRIVEKEFRGTLSVHSELGEGSTFTLYLPHREP